MRVKVGRIVRPDGEISSKVDGEQAMDLKRRKIQIGRVSCRERVC